MKKKFLIAALMIFMLVITTACQTETNTKESSEIEKSESQEVSENEMAKSIKLKITTPNAPNSIPIFYMKENKVLGENVDFEVAIHKSGQEAVAKAVKGEVDMANFGVQEAAKLYNENVDIRLMDVSTWATFEIMTDRDDIKTWEDFKGKKVWLGDKNGPIDFASQIVFKENGLDMDKDMEINRLATKDLVQMVLSDLKEIDAFILREPFTSQVKNKNKDIVKVFNIGEEYENKIGEKIPQGGTIIQNKFLEENAEFVAKFQEEYKKAILWVNENPEEAGVLGAKYMEGSKAKILESAVKNMDMNFLSIDEAKTSLDTYFKLAIDINPSMLENKLPDEKFYEKLY